MLETEQTVMDQWEGNGTYRVTYTVKTMTPDTLSILMDGTVNTPDTPEEYTFKYTYNIDLNTGESIRLKDHVDVEKLAENMFAGTGYYVKEDLADLKEQKLTLLKAAGYPADYMELRYDCPDCQDTGYVNGKRCHCFERQRLNILYAQSNIEAVLKEENFDHLRFDFYDDTEKVPQLGMTERAYMDVVVRQCREFAQQYPDKGNSILFTGGTGVGKTFLTNCIAKALIDRCISVIYLSSNEQIGRASCRERV